MSPSVGQHSAMVCTHQAIKLEIKAGCLGELIECTLLSESYTNDFIRSEFLKFPLKMFSSLYSLSHACDKFKLIFAPESKNGRDIGLGHVQLPDKIQGIQLNLNRGKQLIIFQFKYVLANIWDILIQKTNKQKSFIRYLELKWGVLCVYLLSLAILQVGTVGIHFFSYKEALVVCGKRV